MMLKKLKKWKKMHELPIFDNQRLINTMYKEVTE